MGIYKYLRQMWNKPTEEHKELAKSRYFQWRRQPATVRVDHPMRLDRAHSLGYKAKPGFFIVRQRVRKGGRMRTKERGGRKPKHRRLRKVLTQNFKTIAEQRVARKFNNCEILNSYWVGRDKMYEWYEVITADRSKKAVLNTFPHLKRTKNRALRGLTSAGKKARGLRHKGTGAEKMRGKYAQRFRK